MIRKSMMLIMLLVICATVNARPFFIDEAGKTLKLNILQVTGDSTGKKSEQIPATLAYDFQGQYPYYKVNKHNWKGGELLQLQFSQMPADGHLYVFSIDGRERFKVFRPVHVKDVAGDLNTGGFLFPSKDSAIVVDTQNLGRARICIWFALKNPLNQFEALVRGMEFTSGTIMQRVNRQIARRLYLPCEDWCLKEDFIGFSLSPNPSREVTDDMVIPVILEFTNGSSEPKTSPEKMSAAKARDKSAGKKAAKKDKK